MLISNLPDKLIVPILDKAYFCLIIFTKLINYFIPLCNGIHLSFGSKSLHIACLLI